jgi:hypothetical protein
VADLDERLERMQADGQITVGDADEVRNFASFLRSAPPPVRKGDDGKYSPEDAKQMRDALWEHYPDQYPELDPNRDQEVSP